MSEALRDLVTSYADAVTDRDEAAWASTWTADATWDVGRGEVVGLDAIVETWRRAMGRFDAVVQVVQHGQATEDGDVASGRWVIAEVSRRGGADHPDLLLGRYHDRYRREPAGWRIASRRLEVLFTGALPAGTFPPR